MWVVLWADLLDWMLVVSKDELLAVGWAVWKAGSKVGSMVARWDKQMVG